MKNPDIFSPKIKGIILQIIITLKKNSFPKTLSKIQYLLRGVQWLFLTLLRLGVIEPLLKTVKFIINYLKLCQELSILANKFQNIITIFAN